MTIFRTVLIIAFSACVFSLGALSTLTAQTFSLKGVKTTEAGSPGSYVDTYAEVKNLTGDDLEIRIQRIRNNLPEGWNTSICLINCYPPEVEDVVETIGPNETGFLKLTFETATTPGEGEAEVVLTSMANPLETYNIVFKVSTLQNYITDRASLLKGLSLEQNYPNPFSIAGSSVATIGFSVPKSGAVSLKIYNLLGKEVRILVNESRPVGVYMMTWDARDNAGNTVPPGVYIYKISSGNSVMSRRMVVMR